MPQFCCPKCKSSVAFDKFEQAYTCSRCSISYPVVDGIADFRVYADPYISLEDDRARALLLAQKADELSLEQLLAFYYSLTPELPSDLVRHYSNHHLAGVTRGEGVLKRFAVYGLAEPRIGETVLDIGCGSGGFIAACAARGASVIGVDVALRWLIVARKRLQELGCETSNLVCACADYLPFADTVADVIVAENLIEHVRDQKKLFAEFARVRKAGSRLMARTVNRFVLGPEPHVGVWGVGYLPRALMQPYVRLVRKLSYEHVHLQSASDLRRSIQSCGDVCLVVRAAQLSAHDYQHQRPIRRFLFAQLSAVLRRGDWLANLVGTVGPYFDVVSETKSTIQSRRQHADVVAEPAPTTMP